MPEIFNNFEKVNIQVTSRKKDKHTPSRNYGVSNRSVTTSSLGDYSLLFPNGAVYSVTMA